MYKMDAMLDSTDRAALRVQVRKTKELYRLMGYDHPQPMKCDCCGSTFHPRESLDMMRAMYGPNTMWWDEDYIVLTYGLCTDCWPEC